jgi:hypothetical protein
MGSAALAIIAVAGTILGSALTYFFQSRTSARNDYVLALRSSVAEFCTATMIYRGAESDRWYVVHQAHAAAQNEEAADARVRETRTSARNALYRIELATGSPTIHRAVREAFTATKSIKDAGDAAEASRRRDEVEAKLDDVTRLARLELGVKKAPILQAV